MFAPHHQDAADELVRVCMVGGTVGLLSWTPDGMLGALFATMKPFAPPPPPGAQPPPLWGSEEHLAALGATQLFAWVLDEPLVFPSLGATAFLFFLLGGIEALVMRVQLARPENGVARKVSTMAVASSTDTMRPPIDSVFKLVREP